MHSSAAAASGLSVLPSLLPRARIDATALLVSTHRRRRGRRRRRRGRCHFRHRARGSGRAVCDVRPRLSLGPSVVRPPLSLKQLQRRSALLSKYSLALSLSLVTRL